MDGENEQLSATLEFPLSDRWTTSITIDSFTEDNLNIGAFGTTDSRAETRSLRWKNDIRFSDQNTISFGFDSKEQELDYSTFGALQSENSRDNQGVYGVFLHSTDALDITLSLRNDDDEGFGNHSTGSIALGNWQSASRSDAPKIFKSNWSRSNCRVNSSNKPFSRESSS